MIRVVRGVGGFTSWAHPSRQDVERSLGRLVAAGLQGLEGFRPGLNSADRTFYRKAARRYGLVLTGGSDWHGWTDGELGRWSLEGQALDPFFAALGAA